MTLDWPELPDPGLARAFLLGYFDGDGFVTWSRNGRYLYPRWGLCGTKAFLFAAMQLISNQAGVAPRVVRRQAGTNIHVLHINGADAFAVDLWIHSENELGLDRKRLARKSTRAASSA